MPIYAGQVWQASDLAPLLDPLSEQTFSDDQNEIIDQTNTAWTDWPAATFSVTVPSWATRAVVSRDMDWLPQSGAITGEMRTVLGAQQGSVSFIGAGGSGTGVRGCASRTDVFDVSAIAGTTINLKTQARKTGGTTGGIIGRGRSLNVRFLQS